MPDRRPTEFETRVYEALLRVPAGRVTTYSALAEAVGCGSSRAVGQAMKRNPYAPRVPCHRVIASDLSVGGFSGRRTGATIKKKLSLLSGEGVRFRNGRLADPNRLFDFRDPPSA
jgi:methylated-DNA-[protein]-cysteine S-methyltransferase